jgi:Uma2 family endonuclease
MQAHSVLAHAHPRRMTRSEYDRLVAQGMFAEERVELIHGIVVEMAPVGPPHSDPIDVLNRFFVRGVGDRAVVRVQLPVAASGDSEPEPDIALVPPGRYADKHPDRAFLIVEVADTSLDYDRETKGPLCAASEVAEYWIVDVKGRAVEAYGEPNAGRYARLRRYSIGESLAPVAFPELRLAVGDLFVDP